MDVSITLSVTGNEWTHMNQREPLILHSHGINLRLSGLSDLAVQYSDYRCFHTLNDITKQS